MKKNFCCCLLVVFCKFLTAQDTIRVDDYYNSSEKFTYNIQQIDVFKYEYNNKIIGEREMKRMLMKTNNKSIIRLVQLSKEANAMQYIGFGAIPLGISGLIALAFHLSDPRIPNNSLTASALFFSGAITCPILSKVYRSKRIDYNHKAIKLYNETY